MTDEHADFREVAHCGGKVTFHIKTDGSGVRTFSVGYSGSSPNAMSLFGVYALPQGIVCGNIEMGGIGQPWNVAPFADCLPVLIGSDSHGQLGHECPQCKGYWRSSGSPARWKMTCAYCGIRGDTWQFLTAAQRRYVSHYCATLTDALDSSEADLEVVIDMDAASDASTMPKPAFYYAGQTQQTRFKCEACRGSNDLRGQYGYCSSCGTRNNVQILKAELEGLRERLNEGKAAPADALKAAVSAFDSCCRNLTAQLVELIPLTAARKNAMSRLLFHNAESAAGDVRGVFDINLFDGIDAKDAEFLRMMFQRRHAFEHDGGHATAKYITESGDTSVSGGALIRENRENVHRLIGLLNRMATHYGKGFHELFPPEEIPLSYERERQERMKRGRERR